MIAIPSLRSRSVKCPSRMPIRISDAYNDDSYAYRNARYLASNLFALKTKLYVNVIA